MSTKTYGGWRGKSFLDKVMEDELEKCALDYTGTI